MMPALLGLDLGTSSFKVSAYRETGEYLGTVSRPTPWRSGPSGRELTPGAFAEVVRDAIDECAGAHADGAVAGLGVTGMAETVFIETDDGVLHPARAWNDRRDDPALPPRDLAARTGLLDVPRSSAVELRRVADAGGRVRGWSGLPEHAVRLLGGAAVAERSLASRSGLVDVRAGDWSPALRAWAGVDGVEPHPLTPAGAPAGRVVAGAAAGAVLTVAGHDHLTASLGAGADDGRSVFDSLGTGEGIVARVAEHSDDLTPGRQRALMDAGFNVGLGIGATDVIVMAGLGSGNRLTLLLDALDAHGFGRADVLAAEGVPTDPEVRAAIAPELEQFVETLGGPDWPSLRPVVGEVVAGAVPDLAIARTLWWATVVRLTRNARDVLDAARRLIPQATRLVAAGGWYGNAGIRAVRERMLGAIELPPVAQAGTRGAALLAGLAAGVYASRIDFPLSNGPGETP
jgi:sugar (pentulose or hexulose) kinase